MSWAEFQIRLDGVKQRKEISAMLFREVAYEVHTLRYMMGKKHPPKKENWWPIGKKKRLISEKAEIAFKKQFAEYQKELKKK